MSLALAVMATVPFFVALIEPVVRRKRLDPSELGLGVVAIVGLWWMYRVDVDQWQGMVLALVSAFSAALFGTLNSVWSQKASALAVSRLELAVACGVLAVGISVGGVARIRSDTRRLGVAALVGIAGDLGGFCHHGGGHAGAESIYRGDGHQP